MKSKFAFSNIFIIGLVSLFIDMSTEMVYPLIPLFFLVSKLFAPFYSTPSTTPMYGRFLYFWA